MKIEVELEEIGRDEVIPPTAFHSYNGSGPHPVLNYWPEGERPSNFSPLRKFFKVTAINGVPISRAFDG